MTTVFFATNRKPMGDPTQPASYGAAMVGADPALVTYARAEVANIALSDAGSGTITQIADITPGGFSAAATNAIVTGGRNLFVFIHGFANAFEDAIKRAAFNREWYADTGIAAADTTVVTFTWPSPGTLIAAPPHLAPDAYKADQARAGKSGVHIAGFLQEVVKLQAAFRATRPNGRVFLLAHSMGNYALQAAVQSWADMPGAGGIVFDEVILPAADEIDDSFERKGGGRLSTLPQRARRISIYHSRKDVTMFLAAALNLSERLGFDGPDHKHDAQRYPPTKFRIVDVTPVSDFDLLNPPDATHQYYRRSKIVRADIAATMRGDPPSGGGLITL